MVKRQSTFLVVGGGRESLPFISRLSDRDLNPLVLDGDPTCHASKHGFPTETVRIDDPPAAASFALRLANSGTEIVGVASFGVDWPMTVAAIASELGLPGIPCEAAATSANKSRQKELLEKIGLRTPKWTVATSIESLGPQWPSMSFPVVIKPVDSRGSRGVTFCPDRASVLTQFRSSLAQSRTGLVLIEEFQRGTQFSSETVVRNGRATTVGISTRNYQLNSVAFPEFLENGGEASASVGQFFVDDLNSQVSAIAQSLRIDSGTVKGDLALDEGEICWIEFALRPGGGYFGSHEIPLATGINFIDIVIDLSLGSKITNDRLTARKDLVVCQRFLFAKWGAHAEVRIPESLLESPSILMAEIFDDQPRRRLGGNLSKVGMILGTGHSRTDAINATERAVNAVVAASRGLENL